MPCSSGRSCSQGFIPGPARRAHIHICIPNPATAAQFRGHFIEGLAEVFFPTSLSIFPLASLHTAAAAKSLQSCPTLCDPTDGSPPGSPAPGILQAGTLEWVAISFSNA